jgi:hypothetical protein
MATDNDTAQSIQGLRGALQEADLECQTACQEISALCRTARARAQESDNMSSQDVSRLLHLIQAAMEDAANAVNCRAEGFGCNATPLG